jgi:hypothetical protein
LRVPPILRTVRAHPIKVQITLLIKVLIGLRRHTFTVGARVFLKAIKDLRANYEDGTCEQWEIFSMEHILGCKPRTWEHMGARAQACA